MPVWLTTLIAKLVDLELSKLWFALIGWVSTQAMKLKRAKDEKKATADLQEKTDAKASREERRQSEKDFLNS